MLLFRGLQLHWAEIRASSGLNIAGVPSQANFHIACRAGILDWDTSEYEALEMTQILGRTNC